MTKAKVAQHDLAQTSNTEFNRNPPSNFGEET
jgi:hypothetical protein